MASPTFSTYIRLLGYTRPYWLRLVVGLVAGLFVGGSLFGALRCSPVLIREFLKGTVQAAPTITTTTPAATPVPIVSTPAMASTGTAVTASPGRIKDLESFQKVASRFGIETVRPDGSMTWQFLLILVLGLPFFMMLRSLTIYINHYCMRWIGARAVVDLRNQLFDRLLAQSLKYFGKIDVGHLISRCTYDTSMVESAIANTVADLVQAPVEIAAAAVFIMLTAAEYHMLPAVAALFIVFPLIILPIVLLGRYVKRYTRRALERISDLVSRMQEVFTGIRVIKAYHTEAEESARFLALARSYFRTVIRILRYELMMAPLMEFVAVTIACGFLVYCYSTGIGFDIIIPVGGAAILAYRPVKVLAKVNASLQRTTAAAERLFAILDTDTALPEKPDAIPVAGFQDKIVFDHVSFRYESEGLPVLTDLSFTLPRGGVAAFVGRTGSGKTTVASIMARFYDVTAGRVLLDGHDVRDLKIASLRRLIGVVTQETILFNDTIAANIAYGTPGVTREEIIEAAKKANAHDFIAAEPEGYDRMVGDKGFRLSGGQRQRIAIARAILRNPPILILDEATSALDTVTEQQVQEALYRLMQDRTVLVIAHRLSTIRRADCIYVLEEGGCISEKGSHAELYASGGGYRRLCDNTES